MSLGKGLLLGAAVAVLAAGEASAAQYRVADQAEYKKVTKSLKAGDEVVLANGEWRDFQILFEGKG